jgi:hypothetical protein
MMLRLLASFGLGHAPAERAGPDYRELMKLALERIRTAEVQIREATSLEELDTARASLRAAQAEVVQLVRTVKRERGYPLRPIAECEEMHRRLVESMAGPVDARKRKAISRPPA